MSKDALFDFHFFHNALDFTFFETVTKKENAFEIEIVEVVVKKLLLL